MRPYQDYSLYLVTHRNGLALDIFFEKILLAIKGGVTIVQLREKNTPYFEIIQIGKKLLTYLKPLKIPLIINDNPEIAREIGADGVHLGQSDLSISKARAILGSKAIIGLSIETIDQAIKANLKNLDYIAASPVFQTVTKVNCKNPWGVDGLKNLCRVSHPPVVAIGGINLKNIHRVIECKVAGVAVVSAIFDTDFPEKVARKMALKMKR